MAVEPTRKEAAEIMATTSEDDLARQRARLAQLLGDLLARYWLRFRAELEKNPDEPDPEPADE